ncbi:uncharacterized protein LOC131031603 [Cryptomeria japonica]|uniref:uncharacterized protein LOC131031603 n=1 Tax=Cryptomeria japonica TaxID=3369 RepID=UPI0027DA8404|nr:uncharacterized protein LOC131031603 [Cryptomeria japonica]
MVNGLKVEDRLDGASNFTSWKFRVLIALEKNDNFEFVEKEVPEPDDETEKTQWRKNDTKAKKILIESIKDHLVPIISKLKTTKTMFETLQGMYEINNTIMALALRQQFHHIKMAKGESILSFFMKTTELKDQLGAIGDEVENRDLVMLALNVLPQSWESFIQRISGRSKLPKFDCLRANCIQEESRLAARGIDRSSCNEDNYVLATQTSNRKRREGRKGNFKRNRNRKLDATPK